MRATTRPLFSVILPTRNRSLLFAAALRSVLEQCFRDFEIIVVNDGSSEEHEPHYRELIGAAPELARMVILAPTRRGNGQAYALNVGASEACGEYLCFLDDDDQWTDPNHLGRAAQVIKASGEQVDLLLANQRAFRNGTPVPGVIWIEDLKDRVRGAPDAGGAYTVTAAELLRCPAHCHLNTTIASRQFFFEIGGLDDDQRYETDRDFFLRAIDRARLIKYLPSVVSRHNIPDPTARANMSTIEPELVKRLHQLRVFDRVVLFSVRPELRRYAMRQRAYILKHIATEAARLGRFDCAAYYASEALMTGFTLRWFGVSALFAARRLAPGRTRRAT
jgi:glycosyltransferase involved in cell wall biosynthesis